MMVLDGVAVLIAISRGLPVGLADLECPGHRWSPAYPERLRHPGFPVSRLRPALRYSLGFPERLLNPGSPGFLWRLEVQQFRRYHPWRCRPRPKPYRC